MHEKNASAFVLAIALVVTTNSGLRAQPIEVGLEVVATGLTAPLHLTHAGDGSGRLFIVDQIGQIRVVDSDGALLAAPFLDLTSKIVTVNDFFDERGLLGLAAGRSGDAAGGVGPS